MDMIPLICPPHARSGQLLYYEADGVQHETRLPPGVKPGDRFLVKRPVPVRPVTARVAPTAAAAVAEPASSREEAKETPKPRPKTARSRLPDQAWWEQWGFRGSISELKRNDCGIPKWSPYHRSNDDDAVQQPVNLPPDAFWFKQWGFRTGGVSEDMQRDYGHGVPIWSPYYRKKR